MEGEVAAGAARGSAPAFDVCQENRRRVELFLRCGRSWEIAVGMAGLYYQGIKPESMESVMRMSRVPLREREALLEDLQLMAAAAAPILNGNE